MAPPLGDGAVLGYTLLRSCPMPGRRYFERMVAMSRAVSFRESLAFMRGNILVLTLTRVLGQFARCVACPDASLYILSLGGQPAQIGWLNSLAPLAGLLAFPLAGYLSDHAGRVRLIGLAGFFSAFIYLLYALAPGWQVIALATLLNGLAVAQFPPTSAIIADSLAPAERSRGIAIINSIAGAPAMIAPYVAGNLLKNVDVNLGMRLLYGSITIAYGISAYVNLRCLRETSPTASSHLSLGEIPGVLRRAYSGIPALLRQFTRPLRVLAVVLILGFVANAIAGPFWVVYAIEHIGLSSAEWGLILLVENILRTVGYLPAGILSDRLGRTPTLLLSLLLTALSVPFFIGAQGFWPVLVLRAVVGVSNALLMPASAALLADLTPREVRGRVMAAIGRGTVMIGAGGTGGPGLGFLVTLPLMVAAFAAGYLYEADPRLPWYLLSGILALCLALTALYIRDPKRAEA